MRALSFPQLVLVAGMVLAAAPPSSAAAPVELTVSAAASLKDVLEELAAAYRQRQPHAKITLNLGGSGALQKQLEHGAPVDVFISASPRQLDALDARQLLLPGTRALLARNTLVVVAPRGSPVRSLGELASPSVRRVALGEPASVPAGSYAREALISLKLWQPLQGRTVFAKDVRQVLNYVATGVVDAGLVYATDARKGGADVVLVASVPEAAHTPIVYPLAVLRHSAHPDEARRFTAFLTSDTAQAVLVRHGFLPPRR